MAGHFLNDVKDLTPLQQQIILLMEDILWDWKAESGAMLTM